ncbi:MAG: hypothetical protein JXP34_00015 [Planctomycetes bacterium]|nr:hypothetical protein [Planctomycetota bacterium]
MIVYLTFALLAAEPAPPPPSDLAKLVPAADTFLLARFPSLAAAWEGFRSLPLYRAYKDEEVQEFIRSSIDGLIEKAAPEASTSLAPFLRLPEAFGGEVALAVIGPPEDAKGVLSLAHAGDAAAARGSAEKTIVPLLASASFGEPERKTIEGVEVLGFAGPTGTKALAFDGRRVLVAANEEILAGLLRRRGAPAGSLAEDPTYRRVLARAGDDLSFFFYLNLGMIWDRLARDGDEEDRRSAERSGLLGIRAIGAGLRMADGRATDAIWLDVPDGPKGFLRAMPDVPLEFGTTRLAPRESFAYVAANVRPADVYRTMLAVAEAGSGGPFEELARADRDLAKGLGLRSLSDIIGLLGTEAGVFASFPPGGGVFPEAVAAIEVLEPDKLLTNLDALVRTASGREPSMLTFRGREIRYYAQETRIPFTPCWCVTDGWLLISYHPTMIKSAIRRIEGTGESLRDDPAFEAARKTLPERSVAAAFANTERLFRFLYGIVIPVAGMIGAEFPFNAAELPSADAIARHLSFGLSGITAGEDGIAVRTRSDGYGPTSLGLYGTIVALAFNPPFDRRDEVVEDHPCCGRNLRDIHEAIEGYRGDHGKYPEKLDLLFAEDDDRWRRWSARCPAVEGDRPGDRAYWEDFGYLISERKIDPPAALPDNEIIIWDSAPRHNGGRIVLLAGGDVTWMREAEFRKRLEAQEP